MKGAASGWPLCCFWWNRILPLSERILFALVGRFEDLYPHRLTWGQNIPQCIGLCREHMEGRVADQGISPCVRHAGLCRDGWWLAMPGLG